MCSRHGYLSRAKLGRRYWQESWMRMRHDKCGEVGVCSQSYQLDLSCAHKTQLPVVVPGDNGDVIRPNNIWRSIVRLRNETFV